MTATELKFQITAVGDDQLKKVAIAVESVGTGTRLAGAQLRTFDATLNSLVSSGKSYTAALKEMAASQGVLSSSVVSTSQALLKHAGVVEEVEVATHKLVGANIAAGAAMRDLTGQSNVRAVENLLSNVLGLGTAFQSLFVFTGAFAAGEMLYKLWEKYDPLTKATKALAEENKKLDQTYITATTNIERYIEASARATLGPSGGRSVASFDAETQRLMLVAQANYVQGKIDKLAPALRGPGGKGRLNRSGGSPEDVMKMEALQGELEGFNIQIREMAFKKRADDDQAAKDKAAEDKAAGRPAAELKKRQHEAEIKAQKDLEEALGKELIGLDAILAKREAIVEAANSELTPTKKILDLQQQTTAAIIAAFNQKMGLDAIGIAGDFEENQTKYRERLRKEQIADLIGSEDKPWMQDYKRDQTGIGRVEARGDAAEDERIRREAQTPALRGKRSNTDDPIARELQSYTAMVEASGKIFLNDTKRLDIAKLDADLKRVQADFEFHISEEEWADEEKLADARKKNADELYALRQAHEAALANEQHEDLVKYESMAGRIFAALTGKRGSVGDALKAAALGQAGQVFSNLTAPILQSVGHTLGGLTGGSTLGGALKGTILDPKNAETAIVDHTKRTADGVHDIFTLLSGNGSKDPATATGAAGNGSAVSAIGKATGLGGLFSGISQVLKLGAGASDSSAADFAGTGAALGGGLLDMKAVLPAARMTTAEGIGAAATVATSALAIANGISSGGAKGGLTAAGGAVAAAGTAISAISKLMHAASPILKAAGPVGDLIGVGLGLVSSFLPDSHAIRAKQISDELTKNQYLANTALNVTQSSNGTYADFDAHGMLHTSDLRAVPTVTEPYITSRRINGTLQYADAPGSVITPYSRASTQAPKGDVHIHVNAIDTQSGVDFIMKHHMAIGESLATHLERHEGRAANGIRFVTNTN